MTPGYQFWKVCNLEFDLTEFEYCFIQASTRFLDHSNIRSFLINSVSSIFTPISRDPRPIAASVGRQLVIRSYWVSLRDSLRIRLATLDRLISLF